MSTYKSDQKHKYQNSVNSKQYAPTVSGNTYQRGNDAKALPRMRSAIKCFYCQKANHTISECRLRKKHEANKDNKSNSEVKENMVIEANNASVTTTAVLIRVLCCC